MKNLKRSMVLLFSAHYFLLIIFCLPLLWNLLRPGFYVSDDGEWMAIRLTAFHQSLKEGQFPVRWVRRLNHEYGYPVFNFLYPLPFYLAEPIYMETHDPTMAIKTIMGLSVVSMALGMYLVMKSKGEIPALAAALIYIYSPYIAFDLYQRGSFGEIVAMGIVPWIFWSIRTKRFPLASLLIAGLVMSHNVVAVLFFPLVVLYCLLQSLRTSKLKCGFSFTSYVLCLILALSLSSTFWFPALTELKYVRASQFSVSNFQDEYLQIGHALERVGVLHTALTLGIPVYLTTHNASWIWNYIPAVTIIQFPWRILSVFSFISSLILGWLVWKIRMHRIFQVAVICVTSIMAIVSSWKFLIPQAFIDRPPSYYQTNDDTTTVQSEYTPIWVKELPKNRLEVPTQHYYPGWKAFVGAVEIPLIPPQGTGGILVGIMPRMLSSSVIFRWSETPLRASANIVSALSFLFILFWYQKRTVQ